MLAADMARRVAVWQMRYHFTSRATPLKGSSVSRPKMRMMKESRTVQVGITLAALFVALAHLLWPSVKIDAITVTLVVIAALPWLGPLFKSVELPGGMKIEYQELKDAEKKAEDAGLLSKPKQAVGGKLALQLPFDSDPNLALAGLRIELERRLTHLAELRGVQVYRRGLDGLISALRNTNTFDVNQEAALRELAGLLNAAVHGAKVDERAAGWAAEVGPALVAALDERIAHLPPAG